MLGFAFIASASGVTDTGDFDECPFVIIFSELPSFVDGEGELITDSIKASASVSLCGGGVDRLLLFTGGERGDLDFSRTEWLDFEKFLSTSFCVGEGLSEQATKSPERNGLLPSSGFDTSSDLKSDSLDEVHLNVS